MSFCKPLLGILGLSLDILWTLRHPPRQQSSKSYQERSCDAYWWLAHCKRIPMGCRLVMIGSSCASRHLLVTSTAATKRYNEARGGLRQSVCKIVELLVHGLYGRDWYIYIYICVCVHIYIYIYWLIANQKGPQRAGSIWSCIWDM